MSMIFMDSCGDAYGSAQVEANWDTVSVTAPTVETAGGRNDTNGLKLAAATTFFAKNVAGLDEYFVGLAFRLQALTTTIDVLEFNEGAINHVRVTILANGAIEVSRDGTVLATSAAGTILSDGYNFLEVRAVIDGAAGIVTVDLDETNVHTLVSQNTENGGSGLIDEIRHWGTTDIVFYDDIYINNNLGAAPQNAFLGNTHIGISIVAADGALNEFPVLEPVSPTDHFEKVNEVPPDEDTSFVASDTPGEQELFTLQGLPTILGDGTIYGVQVSVFAKKDNAGTRQIKPLLNPGVTTASGTDLVLSTSYDYAIEVWQQNPDTVADWADAAEVEACEIGCEVT
jgi:hypothetical protein